MKLWNGKLSRPGKENSYQRSERNIDLDLQRIFEGRPECLHCITRIVKHRAADSDDVWLEGVQDLLEVGTCAIAFEDEMDCPNVKGRWINTWQRLSRGRDFRNMLAVRSRRSISDCQPGECAIFWYDAIQQPSSSIRAGFACAEQIDS